MREKYESLSAAVLRELAKARGMKGISTAAYKVDVASDRRRHENVPRHIPFYAGSEKLKF